MKMNFALSELFRRVCFSLVGCATRLSERFRVRPFLWKNNNKHFKWSARGRLKWK